jgi:hypothetical protein
LALYLALRGIAASLRLVRAYGGRSSLGGAVRRAVSICGGLAAVKRRVVVAV